MKSLLIITSVEELQNQINSVVNSFKDMSGIYVSLNKTKKSIENIFKENKINTKKLFFIDCVSSEKIDHQTIQIPPTQLKNLNYAIKSFIEEIKGKKFLIIDALSTLLIYNNENKVAAFIREVIDYASKKDIELVAFSPKTKGEELLNKIFNFFDNVEKK